MIFNSYSIAFHPMIPWPMIAIPLAGVFLLSALSLWHRAHGSFLRLLSGVLLALLLLRPALVTEQRSYLSDIALALIDRSPSQSLEDRQAQADKALATLRNNIKSMPNMELRVVESDGGKDPGENGTRLFDKASEALAAIPPNRQAGLILITDGQIHDIPGKAADINLSSPLNVLLTGDPQKSDRRIDVIEAPSFGLMEKNVTVVFRAEDLGESQAKTATIILHQDGEKATSLTAEIGKDTKLELPIRHSGQNVFEIEVEAAPQELTLANNRTILSVHGVREQLNVLLISGEPYPGERTWRNLLKSDPSVNLVHFTILRSPQKQDATPVKEVALIPFPVEELFDVKLKEFDLIIFDRFQHLGILPETYLTNIVDYVKAGGALLESAGPSSAGDYSLYRTSLAEIFGALPTGEIRMRGFVPTLSPLGEKHPVTNALFNKEKQETPVWGRWFRQIAATVTKGDVVMKGESNLPLLVLSHIEKGRVAQIFSDHIWLWSRGFEGGGPHAEFIRRIVHWLLREPELEEEALNGTIIDGRLQIQRQSLSESEANITITEPDGHTLQLKMPTPKNGKSLASIEATKPGLYKASDSTLNALAIYGALNPKEWLDPRASDQKLLPLIQETKGRAISLTRDGEPSWRQIAAGKAMSGLGWLGLRKNDAYEVKSLKEKALLPEWVSVLLSLGLIFVTWRQESRT